MSLRWNASFLLVATIGLISACTQPTTSNTSTTVATPPTTTAPPPTSPPATAPQLEIPEVGPDAWDRTDLPDDAVVVTPGTNPQTLIDDNPPGLTLVFGSGVHDGIEITRLKDGTRLLGEPGAVLDGQGRSQFAIASYGDDVVFDVVIRGLIVENYQPPIQLAPVGGDGSSGWIVEYNEIRESAAAGLQLGDASVARYNDVHHNRQIGIKTGSPTTGVLIEGNVVAENNYRNEFEYDFEAGGMKIVNSRDVRITGNYVHSNHGPGIWTDGNNVGARVDRNIVTDNHGPGIFHEISYAAVITENIVERNAFEFYIGGILVASSSGVEVSRNALSENDGGVIAIQEDRGGGDLGEFVIEDLVVTENLIQFTEGSMGVLDNVGDSEVFDRRIEFAGNTYVISETDGVFMWSDPDLDRNGWLEIHPTDR